MSIARMSGSSVALLVLAMALVPVRTGASRCVEFGVTESPIPDRGAASDPAPGPEVLAVVTTEPRRPEASGCSCDGPVLACPSTTHEIQIVSTNAVNARIEGPAGVRYFDAKPIDDPNIAATHTIKLSSLDLERLRDVPESRLDLATLDGDGHRTATVALDLR